MDPDSLAQQSKILGEQTASTETKLPQMLETLRSNVEQIYNKNNPLIQQREGLLQGYLGAGDQARAQLLPQNAGGTVFSPTELQSLTSARQAGYLAPLTSLNQLITGQYGTLGNYLGNARDMVNAQVNAGNSQANRLLQLSQLGYEQRARQQASTQQEFQNQLALQKLQEAARQFNVKQTKKAPGTTDIGSLFGSLFTGQTENYPTKPTYKIPSGPLLQNQWNPYRALPGGGSSSTGYY